MTSCLTDVPTQVWDWLCFMCSGLCENNNNDVAAATSINFVSCHLYESKQITLKIKLWAQRDFCGKANVLVTANVRVSFDEYA